MLVILRMLLCFTVLGAASAYAQTAYPGKAVRVIVPLPPGGAADLVARTLGDKLAEVLGQQFLIDNRPGAGTNLGPALASKAPADGYTLLLGSITNHAVAVNLYPNPGYDLEKSFAPVALVANAPHILVAHPSLPVRNVREVIALAKSRPGEINFGSQGSGTLAHLEIELLQSLSGAKFTHIPYKGSAPGKVDLVAGQIQLFFDSYASSAALIRDGRMRVIAIASDARSALIPEVPTFLESGVKQYAANNWYGVLVPAGTPKPVIDKLWQETQKILAQPETRAKFRDLGLELTPGAPERLAAAIKTDLATWTPIARRIGVKLD